MKSLQLINAMKRLKKNTKSQIKVTKTVIEDDRCICEMNEQGEPIGGFCFKHKTDWL